MLPSGTTIDTADADADERFAAAEPELAAGLAEIRDEIRSDADLRQRIESKFAIKNTMGYRLCAFLDADEPVEIFATPAGRLGGHARLRLRGDARDGAGAAGDDPGLGPLSEHRAATAPVAELVAAGASAVELMVAPALMVAANSIPGAPQYWTELPLDSAALLIEFGGADADELAAGRGASRRGARARRPAPASPTGPAIASGSRSSGGSARACTA